MCRALLEHAQLAIGDAWLETSKTIFELAINAKSLWKSANKLERLNMLKRGCLNQTLDGPTLRYELRKPFKQLAKTVGCTDWSG